MAFKRFLTETPNLNEHYAAEIRTIQKQLAADFDMSNASLTILPTSAFTKATDVAGLDFDPNEKGVYHEGRMLIGVDPEEAAIYGSGLIVGIALHEGAHARGDRGDVIITEATKQTDTTRGIGELGMRGASVNVTLVDPGTGFRKYHRNLMSPNRKSPANPNGTPTVELLGSFLEEGYADSYRVRRMEKLGFAWEINGAMDGGSFADGTQFGYVGGSSVRPLVGKGTRMYLPWRYAMGVALNPEQGTVQVRSSLPGLAAYGIELLEKRLPGLFDKMTDATNNPTVYTEVIRGINSVQPGLYKNLRRLDCTPAGFQSGLLQIVHALDLQ